MHIIIISKKILYILKKKFFLKTLFVFISFIFKKFFLKKIEIN